MNEYISKVEATETIQYRVCQGNGKEEHICKSGLCAYCEIMDLLTDIANIKAADVQPVKHGKWIEKRKSIMKWIPYEDDNVNPEDVAPESMTEQKCSCCKRWTIKFTYHIELDYCPLCGARMDGDDK